MYSPITNISSKSDDLSANTNNSGAEFQSQALVTRLASGTFAVLSRLGEQVASSVFSSFGYWDDSPAPQNEAAQAHQAPLPNPEQEPQQVQGNAELRQEPIFNEPQANPGEAPQEVAAQAREIQQSLDATNALLEQTQTRLNNNVENQPIGAREVLRAAIAEIRANKCFIDLALLKIQGAVVENRQRIVNQALDKSRAALAASQRMVNIPILAAEQLAAIAINIQQINTIIPEAHALDNGNPAVQALIGQIDATLQEGVNAQQSVAARVAAANANQQQNAANPPNPPEQRSLIQRFFDFLFSFFCFCCRRNDAQN